MTAAPMISRMDDATPTDRALLARWRSGDRSAGDVLFLRHFDSVYAFVRTKVTDDVEDLVQRTFLALVQADLDASPIRSVRSWLLGTARHLLFSHWRARRSFEPSASSLAELSPSPSSILVGRAEQRLLAGAIRRIPVDHQIVLELFYWEGMTGDEIAVCLGEPVGTIRSRLRRARELLEHALSEVAESPELLASTVGDLERWMLAMRDQLSIPGH